VKRLVALITLTSLLCAFVDYVPAEQMIASELGYQTERTLLEPLIIAQTLRPRFSRLQEAVTDLADLVQITDEQFTYLLSLQDETGIIAQTPAQRKSIPYFSNMAALAMLARAEGHAPVRRYLEWYVQHINLPDKYRLLGTIYDYAKVGDDWTSTSEYDSADSYAATFMSLLLNYARVTQDLQFLVDNFQRITDIAEVMLKLQDKDGLIWAKPRYYVKFLMDNAENYRGLEDAAALMKALGRDDLAERYGLAAIRVASGIEKQLWHENAGLYSWALYGRWWPRIPVKKWYPDTIAQIYPIVFGLVAPKSERAMSLYSNLNERYPNWTSGEFDDRFPWTILALVAAQMDDDGRAIAYLRNINERLVIEGESWYPWHAFEAAFFLKAWQVLGTRHVIPTLGDTENADAHPSTSRSGQADETHVEQEELSDEPSSAEHDGGR